MNTVISLKNITKTYACGKPNEFTALNNVSLDLGLGEMCAICGTSGAGKTTLLNIIGLADTATKGEYSLNGEIISSYFDKQLAHLRNQYFGYVLQDYGLISDETVYENVIIPLIFSKAKRKDYKSKAQKVLDNIGIAELSNKKIDTLSGGQKQRVGIARALASNPKVLLCDEATSALDPQTTKSILELLKDINKKLNLTIVLITHQMEVVKAICDRVAVIENGDIIEEGPMVDVFTNPQHPTTKEFTKSVINAEIPDMIKNMKLTDTYKEGSKLIVRISFIGDSASEPIVSGMVKRFAVDVSILYGNIDQLKDVPFGTLIIEVSGDKNGIKNALDYLHNQNLKTEVIGYES